MSTCKDISFFFQCDGDPRDLHSFPTRRSSDLGNKRDAEKLKGTPDGVERHAGHGAKGRLVVENEGKHTPDHAKRLFIAVNRSEEHTSELQSHSDLVCRLLLEKKKNTTNAQRDE